MALKDKGADEGFFEDLYRLSNIYGHEDERLGLDPDVASGEFFNSIEWLIRYAHKSDIGVLHRMIRNKLEG